MLALSTKYALRALLELRNHRGDGFIAIKELAMLAEVPAPYLAKLLKPLERVRIIESKKGVKGGVQLVKDDVNFYDICHLLNDPVVSESCMLSKKHCDSKRPCRFHNTWSRERKSILEFLKRSRLSNAR